MILIINLNLDHLDRYHHDHAILHDYQHHLCPIHAKPGHNHHHLKGEFNETSYHFCIIMANHVCHFHHHNHNVHHFSIVRLVHLVAHHVAKLRKLNLPRAVCVVLGRKLY